mmetsp:Transcript_38103/g.63314  ORF Transcript_38103/g.63314 Transcript_38103/m.63314 type:complete len:261 (-) Transcript_38103:139-921(-)
MLGLRDRSSSCRLVLRCSPRHSSATQSSVRQHCTSSSRCSLEFAFNMVAMYAASTGPTPQSSRMSLRQELLTFTASMSSRMCGMWPSVSVSVSTVFSPPYNCSCSQKMSAPVFLSTLASTWSAISECLLATFPEHRAISAGTNIGDGKWDVSLGSTSPMCMTHNRNRKDSSVTLRLKTDSAIVRRVSGETCCALSSSTHSPCVDSSSSRSRTAVSVSSRRSSTTQSAWFLPATCITAAVYRGTSIAAGAQTKMGVVLLLP